MPLEEMLKLAMNYGLGVLLSIFVAYAFWKILIRVFDENAIRDQRIANILDGSVKSLTAAIQTLNSTMVSHNLVEMQSLELLKEGNKFQRDEHQKMILVLDQIILGNK